MLLAGLAGTRGVPLASNDLNRGATAVRASDVNEIAYFLLGVGDA